MPERVTLPCAGLVTDPSPHMTYPSGAQRIADDVIVCAAGVAQVRPSFPILHSKVSSWLPRALRAFDSGVVVVSEKGGAWQIESSAATYTGNATPPDASVSPTQFTEARKNLYYTSDTGVRKLTAIDATGSEVTGLEMQVATISGTGTGSNGPFTAPCMWAYRIVYVSTDANGYVRRSAPSERFLGSDSGAGSVHIDWDVNGGRVFIPAWLVEGNQVEFYRTKLTASATTIPSTEHYLAFTYTLTSTDITNGYFNPPDDYTADTELGAALYTNPSQQGIVDAKEPPPLAVAVASYQRCTWYGNTTDRHRLRCAILDADADGSTGETGIQYQILTGDFTSASPNITNVATSAGLSVGMALTDATGGPTAAGTNIPADTKILSITGAGPYTITMDKNALASGVGSTFRACDVITISGVEFYAYDTPSVNASGVVVRPQCFLCVNDSSSDDRASYTAQMLAFEVNRYAMASGGAFDVRARPTGQNGAPFGTTAGPGEMWFEEIGYGGSAITLQCTKPAAWIPSTPTSSTADLKPHRLYWSEPDEPEAVPLGQYVDIGSESEPILALVPLRTAMLVFKTDGIWSVSGVAPNSWSLDLLDATQRLVRGGCVDTINNTAIAWTTSGIVAVNEVSVRSLTDGRISRQFAPYSAIMAASPATSGAFVSAWRAADCVLVGVPTEADSTQTTHLYCWHAGTNAWTRWVLSTYCAAHSASTFYLARGGEHWEIRGNSAGLTAEGSHGYDAQHTIGAWTHDGATLTVAHADAGSWEPAAGDWVRATVPPVDAVEFRLVTSVSSTVSDYILTLASAFTTGASSSGQAYEGIGPVLQWQAHSASPIHSALYSEVQYLLDFTDYAGGGRPVATFMLGAQNERASAVESASWTLTPDEDRISTIARIHPSREVARATHFFPYLECSGAINYAWRCLGVGLVLGPVSERTAR